MPITRRQFDLGIGASLGEWMERLHGHLSEHRDQAFTEDELRDTFQSELKELDERRPPAERAYASWLERLGDGAPDILSQALHKLVELDAVEARIVESHTYYAYLRDLPEL